MDSEQITQIGRDANNKHVWTSQEDLILVENMVELCVAGKIKADNGFKPGTFGEIEKMMHDKLPGCGIKAHPHIESRLKYLKNKYNAINEMLEHGSGFAWDEAKKMVICEKTIYDGWVKSHKIAQGLWMKPFPHYDDLALVFGKDRANGRGCFTPTELAEDVEQNTNPHIQDEGLENIVNEDISVTQPRRTTPTGEEGTQSRRKRRKSSDSFTTEFSNLVEAFKLSANAIADSLNKLDEATVRMDKVFSDVFNILGRDDGPRCLRVTEIIMRDPVKVNLLSNMPEELKKDWLSSLLLSD
ncbi:hypothetical protein QJS04_geneDACA024285 [Acorus gramineus]|uniref:Myb/SANT-like domain-containing protein n=1 Tax=Acorus gramineus TaxID=55184 RepID=A0AAV8ZZC2_ACOGR|nr:hypothetical protein QJS04_geneDACA024285 [Acorus gramineus]